MKGSEVQGSTYEAHDGFVWMVGEHKPARLEDEQVNRLLDVFQDAGAAEAFNDLHEASVAAGGIPWKSPARKEAA